MATHSTPVPGPTRHYANTDGRPAWPIWYAIIYGALAGVIGLATVVWPMVFINLMLLGVLILWFLNNYGVANRVPVLVAAPVYSPLIVLVTGLVGLAGAMIGWLTGTVLVDLAAVMATVLGPLTILVPITSLVILGIGTIGLLLATGYRRRTATIVCLIVLALNTAFMAQMAAGISETPYEQTKRVCTSEEAQNFPAECGR